MSSNRTKYSYLWYLLFHTVAPSY